MKRILVMLAVIAAIGAALGYGYLALKPFTVGRASVPDSGLSGTEAQPTVKGARPTVGIPPSDRVWTAGTQEVPVIMYHDVVPKKDVWFDLTTREFERQMQSIKAAGGVVVPLSEVVEHLKTGKPLPPKSIALTFDDNTLGIYENAYPIMKRFGYHSTQFVHTAKVGVRTGKDHCTWDQLREMQDSGLLEVGSHTIDHPADLRALTPDQVRMQLTDSKASIEAEMGKVCRYFAYTEGNGDEGTAQLVAGAGYEAAWNEARAWDAVPCDRMFMARFAPFRLDDILSRWKKADRWASALPAGSTLKNASEAELHTEKPNGVAMALTYATWSGIIPELHDANNLGGIIVPNMLFNLTLAGSAPPERQWGWIGRPLVVASADKAYIVAYQPWVGASPDAIKVLWPESSFVVVGAEQILHDGVPVESRVWRRGKRLASFIGWKADGTPVLGKTVRYCRREALVSALKALGMKEAVLLGR